MDEETKKKLIEWIEKNHYYDMVTAKSIVYEDDLIQAIQSGEFDKPEEKEKV